MFFTERLMLRGLDPEVDNNIWLQWIDEGCTFNDCSCSAGSSTVVTREAEAGP